MKQKQNIEKKIILIVSIIICLGILIGVGKIVYDKVKPQNPNRLLVEYIGDNKVVGDTVTVDDFEFKEVYNEQTYPIEGSNIALKNTKLQAEGTKVEATFVNREGKTFTTTCGVACISDIDYADCEIQEKSEFFIGYDCEPKNFVLTVFDKKGYSAIVPPDMYTVANPEIKEETQEITLSFISNEVEYTPTITIEAQEIYVKDFTASFIADIKYLGEDLVQEDFKVVLTLANGEEFESDGTEFNIQNPLLGEVYNTINLQVLNPDGTTVEKEVEVQASNYCVDIDSAVFVGNPKTIGDVVNKSELEVIGKFYDGTTKRITGFDLDEGVKLEESENTIRVLYKNEIGDTIKYDLDILAEENLLFIGDDRIKDLSQDIAGNGEKSYFVSNSDASYDWLVNEGIAKANAIMEENSLTSFRVVFMCGQNDMDNFDKFIKLYNKLATDTWKQHRIYIASLTPVEEEKIAENAQYDKNVYKNSVIKTFNDKLNKTLKNNERVIYANTYGQMINGNLKTTDGFLLETDSNKYYYELVKSVTK